ncbi:MAG: pyridoxal phosphate-dependent aminotransferase, partial [Deltaproteobacteria bacterium]|nr:pyridoxal phosphate-dependent aminotransferase [Deltaproteobacteria bacterium]
AAGGLNIVFKAQLNPGDEVVAPAPYFVEYDFYAANHGGRLVRAATTGEFRLDAASLEQVLTPRTRAVLINSPHNPTGVVYTLDELRSLARVLREASARFQRPIVLISDEPYRRLVFDGAQVPWLPGLYEHTLVVTSHSKDLGLAGERVGYVAVSPECAEAQRLIGALTLANRILGFVNAPALIQRVLPLLDGASVDTDYYQGLRDLLYPALLDMGYSCVKPQGAFYLFPRSPVEDDVAFVRAAQEEGLLLVPGSGFAGPGHFRISLSVSRDVIERSLAMFERVLKKF